jgi:hypothetical protein
MSRAPCRDFESIRSDLERVAMRLKTTDDPDIRQSLLRHLRVLIQELDAIMAEQ